jgi:hypothetical protein
MSETQSDDAALDRAYADGKLAGFFGLATSDGCPFTAEKTDLRIAWLDGFDYGAWEGAATTAVALQDAASNPACAWGEAAAPDRDERAIGDIAIAHLLRLSKCITGASTRDPELGSALEAAGAFSFLLRLARPDDRLLSGNETGVV